MAASLGGETITLGLEQEVREDMSIRKKEEEEEKVLLENLKETVRELRRYRRKGAEQVWEEKKISFSRDMEMAYLSNCIVKERYLSLNIKALANPEPEGYQLLRKALDYNKKIRWAMSLGLEGIMLGPSDSNKRKRDSAFKDDDDDLETEHELEELKLLKRSHEELLARTVPEDKERVWQKYQQVYRRARRFAKVESREGHLASIVHSLLEREGERREATENEILGYMLLEETAASSLKFPHMLISRLSVKPPNSVPLYSHSHSLAQDDKIVLDLETCRRLHASANDKSNFDDTSAAPYKFHCFLNSVSRSPSEREQLIKQELVDLRLLLQKIKGFVETGEELHTLLAAERRFEAKLMAHYDDLSDIWLARCLNPFSQTEAQQLHEIIRLARNAIQNYAHPIPTITMPVWPAFPSS